MTPKNRRFGLFSETGILTLFVCFFFPGYAFSQAPFYQGKTITIIQGTSAGGTGDLRRRALAPYLRKYIPGNSGIVFEYMPGGGGRKAANYIYKSARPDGLVIGGVSSTFIVNAVLGAPGVQYDIDKFIYLGTPVNAAHYVFMTRKHAGLDSVEKLRSASGVRLGGQEVGHDIYISGRVFAYLVGMRNLKSVAGYGGPELDMALIRGEIDARANLADTVLQRNPEWIEKGLVDFHAIIEIPEGNKHPRFAHLPELATFVRSDKDRKLLTMYRAFRLVGTPYFLPPGTPQDQVRILKEAMRKAFKDPEFRGEFNKLAGYDPTPLMPEELEEAIREIPRDPEIIELFKNLAGAGPLPPR